MCHLITWMPKVDTTGIRTPQHAEFDVESEAHEFAEELHRKGAENIRHWNLAGTLTIRTDTYWK